MYELPNCLKTDVIRISERKDNFLFSQICSQKSLFFCNIFVSVSSHFRPYIKYLNHPTQVSSLQKGEECSGRGDSSALSGQNLLCSGIVFASESRGPRFESRNCWNLELTWCSALQNYENGKILPTYPFYLISSN